MQRTEVIKALRVMKKEGKDRDAAFAYVKGHYKNPKTGNPVSNGAAYAMVRRVYGHAYSPRVKPKRRRKFRHDAKPAKTNPRTNSGFKTLVQAVSQLDLVESDKLALIQLIAEL